MNAPWKAGLAGNRDPFASYVCDDATLDVVRTVVGECGWAPEKCHKGGLRNAVQSLSVSASPNILLVDLSESGDPINDINSLAEVCEPGTVVIAMGQVNDVRLYRDLVFSGLQDYLLKPVSPDQLRDAIAQAQVTLSAPKPGEGESDHPHVTCAVIGTRGGVGASTIATSIAWLFSTEHQRPTALLDLDVHFGTGALAMDLEPGRGLTDAIDNPSRIDGLFIERAMIKANDRLAILSAEASIASPLMTDGAAFLQLQEEFRYAFEASVIDLPRSMLINHPHLMAEVQVAVLVGELTLASARDTIRLLSWLKTQAGHARVIVVANRAQQGVTEISRADYETSIERKIDFVVPFDPKAAANAAKMGQTIVEAAKASKASAGIRQIAQRVLEAGTPAPEEEDAKPGAKGKAKAKAGKGKGDAKAGSDQSEKSGAKSLMSRFGDLKSLMPSKAKK